MRPAQAPPERREDVRLLVIDTAVPARDRSPGMVDSTASRSDQPASRAGILAPNLAPALSDRLADVRFEQLVDILQPGDVLVVNDAATLPASLRAHTAAGHELELRLLGPTESGTWRAVLFGPGTWRTPTEHRPPPVQLERGASLELDGSTHHRLGATIVDVSAVSPRLVELAFDRAGAALWQALYTAGKPVQYSYLERDLELWSVQTIYGGRPWAAEMPSAGRALTGAMLLALRRRGVTIAALTHAAGLSATGDPELDRALPLPERFDIPASTVQAIALAHERGGRVVAVGTTVVRALEGCAAQNRGILRPGTGVTDLIIGPDLRPVVVHGLLTGMHEPDSSHFQLLRGFADQAVLNQAWNLAAERGYRCHEFGDTSLLLPHALSRPAARAGRPGRAASRPHALDSQPAI